MYMYTHPWTHKHIYMQIHIFRYTFSFYTVSYRGTNIKIFKFKKVISFFDPMMWGKFKNFIQTIKTNIVDRIVGYNI